jgi:hypothetical protein
VELRLCYQRRYDQTKGKGSKGKGKDSNQPFTIHKMVQCLTVSPNTSDWSWVALSRDAVGFAQLVSLNKQGQLDNLLKDAVSELNTLKRSVTDTPSVANPNVTSSSGSSSQGGGIDSNVANPGVSSSCGSGNQGGGTDSTGAQMDVDYLPDGPSTWAAQVELSETEPIPLRKLVTDPDAENLPDADDVTVQDTESNSGSVDDDPTTVDGNLRQLISQHSPLWPRFSNE